MTSTLSDIPSQISSYMNSADWSELDPSSEDNLFGGTLFGDELTEMYFTGSHHNNPFHTIVQPDNGTVSPDAASSSCPTTNNASTTDATSSSKSVSGHKRTCTDVFGNTMPPPANVVVNNSTTTAADTTSIARSVSDGSSQESAVPTTAEESANDANNVIVLAQTSTPKMETVANPIPPSPPSLNTCQPLSIPPPLTTTTNPVATEQTHPKPGQEMSTHTDPTAISGDSGDEALESRPKTEADFTAVAQAAVSNLILTAGVNAASLHVQSLTQHAPPPPTPHTISPPPQQQQPPSPTTTSSGIPSPIDTSTAHISTLTSPNWMLALSQSSSDIRPTKRRRHNLTPSERAQLSRDRNREHARNTRLRKKAYVEELKRTLMALVSRRDKCDFERRRKELVEREERDVRFRVMQEFLRLRGEREGRVGRWVGIMEEGFELRVPWMEVEGLSGRDCEMGGGEAGHERVLTSATDIMMEATGVGTCVERALAEGCETPLSSSVNTAICVAYECDAKSFFMDSCTAMLHWKGTTVGAISMGATDELTFSGCIRATFNAASNKLTSAIILFDTATITAELKRVCPKSTPPAPPTTCDAVIKKAEVIIDSLDMPFLTPGRRDTGTVSD